jgi:TatD DNase family protein
LPDDWEEALCQYLSEGAVSVGEIGLDNWIEPRNEDLQRAVFIRQLEIASERNLVPTIHCLRAWGALVDCLRAGPELSRGFLVHGFGGSREVLFELLDLGGHASFSAYAADPGRKRMRDAARACPADRILVETDAPDMVPPEADCAYPFKDAEGKPLHHPAEIATAYQFLANWRGEDLESFATRVRENFLRLFS